MNYEKGKTYEFNSQQFEISYETGRLLFLIENPASVNKFRVRPFDFQRNKLPKKLTCVYKGGSNMEQTMASVVDQVYTVGETYEFRVMQAGKGGVCELRDDASGLNVTHKFRDKTPKRWDRVNCKVVSLEGGKVKLEPVIEQQAKPQNSFTLADLAAIGLDRRMTYRKTLERVMASEVMSEANAMRKRGDGAWVLEALSALRKYLPAWLTEKGDAKNRANWLDALRFMAIRLIEKSTFLSQFSPDERAKRQRQLSDFADSAYQLSHAAWLISEGRDEAFVKETLASLRDTGWLYHPERKMSLLMSLLALRNHYAHDYIHDIFAVVRARHGDLHFMEAFGDALRLMLSMYINTTCKDVDRSDRSALREIIEAIAIELLLTQGNDFVDWNLHRGRMYMYAALIVDKPASALAQKALDVLSGRLDIPLEFGWSDLDDINLMAHSKLNQPVDAAQDEAVSLFEGEHSRLTINSGGVEIAAASSSEWTEPQEAVSYPILADRRLAVTLPVHLKSTDNLNGKDLSTRQAHWKQIATSLSSAADASQQLKPVARPKLPPKKSQAEVGDKVYVRVTGREEDGKNNIYTVSIVDEHLKGEGWFNKYNDVLSYKCPTELEDFYYEGKPLLLPAKVIEKDKDGRLHFTFRPEVVEASKELAEDLLANNEVFKALISSEKNQQGNYYAISEYGFSMAVWPDKDAPELHDGDMIEAVVDYINHDREKVKLFVNTKMVRPLPESQLVDKFNYSANAYASLISYMANYKTYSPEPKPEDAEKEEEKKQEAAEQSAIAPQYLGTSELGELSLLFDSMSIINRRDITLSFDMLGTASLLAKMAGDKYNSEYIETKMALLMALGKFAMFGRLEPVDLQPLEQRCEVYVRLQDTDIIYKLQTLRALVALGDSQAGMLDNSDSPTSTIADLRELVNSYNLMLGKQLAPARKLVKQHIYELLNLPIPDSDEGSLDVNENGDNEFKESLIYPAGNSMHANPKAQKRELMQTVCAFLNSTTGGTLYIGVNNSGVPKGLDNDFTYINSGYSDFDLRDVKDHFSLLFYQALRDQIGGGSPIVEGFPLTDFVKLEYRDEGNVWIARVSITPFPTMVRLSDGTVYVRHDSSTLPVLNKKEVAKFEKERAKAMKARGGK